MSPRRLCLGTSTFAAGRLRPDKDSCGGVATLAAALNAGARMIHSAPKFGTQPAVRAAWEAAGRPEDVQHLIKIELPVDSTEAQSRAAIRTVLDDSAANLGTESFHALVVGTDLRRTVDRALLAHYCALKDFYIRCADWAQATGRVQRTFGYAHSPGQLAAILAAPPMFGVAAQLNPVEAWPGLYLDAVADSGRDFIAVAPLRRGLLVSHDSTEALTRLRSLRWVLAYPAVTAAALSVSSLDHLAEALQAAENPLPIQTVLDDLARWAAVPVAEGDRTL
jgi:aryl-alcohol dehydrogenase-like predicted oxidoreductase